MFRKAPEIELEIQGGREEGATYSQSKSFPDLNTPCSVSVAPMSGMLNNALRNTTVDITSPTLELPNWELSLPTTEATTIFMQAS
jgi:hypothetical protein